MVVGNSGSQAFRWTPGSGFADLGGGADAQIVMRYLWLLVGLAGLVVSGPVWAASYQKIDGSIVDPIQTWWGGPVFR